MIKPKDTIPQTQNGYYKTYCYWCDGSGETAESVDHDGNYYPPDRCPHCKGTGTNTGKWIIDLKKHNPYPERMRTHEFDDITF